MLLPAIELPTLLSMADLSSAATQEARYVAGGLGVLLLFWGPRSKRLAAATPGILLGSLLAASFLTDKSTSTQAIGTASAGVIGGIASLVLQAMALRLAGVLIGAVTAASIYPMASSDPIMPWWIPIAGAILGLFILPKLFRSTLKLLSPVFAAICLSYALGLDADQQLFGLIGFSVVGYAIQAGLGRKASRTDSNEA